MISKIVLERAKQITKEFGRGFYRASFLFDKKTREATWVLYAFVRLPDEMVDSEPDLLKAKADLEKYHTEWQSVLSGAAMSNTDPLLFAAKEVFDTYSIPYEYTHYFFKSMEQDLSKKSYATYEELQRYMYGSASVIGMMMSHIIGFKDGALSYAKALGEAFQLINFLRDVRDDYEERGRIYLPQEDMEKFGVTAQHVENKIVDTSWKNFMIFEIERAKKLLEEGRRGIPLLKGTGKKAVYASYLIYKKIIEEIEKSNFDVFSGRVVVNPFRKTMLLLKAVCKRNL